MLDAHAKALKLRGVREPHTYETQGEINGLGLHGHFHEWARGTDSRRDEQLGARTQRQMRVGGRLFVQNASGDVRELHGLLARRQVTEDAVDSGNIVAHPEYCTLLGPGVLADGRKVIRLRVAPPGGESYTVAFDAVTFLIDEKSFVDGDAEQIVDLSDYAVVDGFLMARTEVESNGDRAYAITNTITSAVVNRTIADSVFAPFAQTALDAPAPVELPLRTYQGLIFTDVRIAGKTYNFLIDSGAQGIVLDPRTARAVGAKPEGILQIRGAARTRGDGVAALDALDLGTAHLPVHVVSVVDLSRLIDSSVQIDGVLGYPFFAASDVRIDPDRRVVVVARPGALGTLGAAVDVDTDRELLEVEASVNGLSGRFFVDTGNAGELLLFKTFLDAHPGAVPFVGGHQVVNRGVGGSNSAVAAIVPQLDVGAYHLYNRYANLILASAGAFADRNDAGNIGNGVLKNFVATFSLASHRLYLQRARGFDDGRFRSVTEPVQIP